MMFKKVLIANRGEIAVRLIRACRELGIRTVALYAGADVGSLHVRISDECAELNGPGDYLDPQKMLSIAIEKGADGIHPGCGFLAEQPEFFRAGEAAEIRVIGPPAAILEALGCRLAALQRAQEAGFPTVSHSPVRLDGGDFPAVQAEADKLGYPLLIKSCAGGRGPGERMVHSPDRLERALKSAQAEALRYYRQSDLYLEKAIQPAYEVGVQIIRDSQGRCVELGEYQSLVQHGNRKVIAESPAPILSPSQREEMQQTALQLAGLLGVENAATVEFLVDEAGNFYFAEIKMGLQLEHPLIEMVSQVDLVQTQIRLAAGEPLSLKQPDLALRGAALLCRVNAEDPWNSFLPSPGRIRQMWMPGGPNVRVDTSVYGGCQVPGDYDPLVVKLTTWGEDRQSCLRRMRGCLGEIMLTGIDTNTSLLQSILSTPEFSQGGYATDFRLHAAGQEPHPETHLYDLAAAAAVVYLLREQCQQLTAPTQPGMNLWQKSLRIPSPWSYTRISNEKNGSHP